MPSVELTLPWPPTLNEAFKPDAHGRPRHTKRWTDYRDYAGIHAKQCLPDCCPFTVPVAVDIAAWPPDRRRRDLDNLLKIVLDVLESMGIYKNDFLVADLRIVRRDVFKGGKLDIMVEPL